MENADWFEDEAIKMLDIMDYQDVREVHSFLNNNNNTN